MCIQFTRCRSGRNLCHPWTANTKNDPSLFTSPFARKTFTSCTWNTVKACRMPESTTQEPRARVSYNTLQLWMFANTANGARSLRRLSQYTRFRRIGCCHCVSASLQTMEMCKGWGWEWGALPSIQMMCGVCATRSSLLPLPATALRPHSPVTLAD